MFAPSFPEYSQCHFLLEVPGPLCSGREKGLHGLTHMCQSSSEQAERDGPPHRADNALALCSDKGAHPCLTSHAVSSDMDRLSPVSQLSSCRDRSRNIFACATKSTSKV